MLKLLKLKFCNIGRFVEEQEIDFTVLGNLVQVDGQNLITGGSSGAGKSTIFNALAYLMGLSDLPLATLQCRYTKSHLTVTGEFDWDGKSVTITRNKKLVIDVDGASTEGSAKIVDEKLEEIIGLPPKLFKKMLYKHQDDKGFFLDLGPAKTNEFLTDVLGLNEVSAKVDKIDLKIKDLETAKTKDQSLLDSRKASLEATQEGLQTIGTEPTTEVTEELLKRLESLLEASQKDLSALKERHKWEKGALEFKKPTLTTIPFDKTQLDTVEKEIKSIEKQIDVTLNAEKDRQTKIKTEIATLKAELASKVSTRKLEVNNQVSENKTALFNLNNLTQTGRSSKETALKLAGQIKTLRSGMCQTCLQPWQKQEAKDEEVRLLEELDLHKTNISAGVFAQEEYEKIKAALIALNDSLNSEIALITKDYEEKIVILNDKIQPKDVNTELQGLNANLREACSSKLQEHAKEELHSKTQNDSNNSVMSAFFEESKLLAERHRLELAKVNSEVTDNNTQYEQVKNQFNTWKTLVKDHQRNSEALKAKIDKLTSEIVQMTSKLDQLIQDLEMAEEVKRCLKSYLSCSYDDALDSISETATRLLRSVPTMANASIRLQGTKEVGSGAIKNQINAVLDNDGELEIPIKSLSGGERSAVDLAIDLAVNELIQEKANKGIDIMILDEPFNGFDSVGIENALEMLKTLDKRILLVEHDSVAKEYIQDKITVVRDGETSTIKNNP